ncbi:MAG: four-carbon acid sugar kinase family protein [Ilumatobacteraceae bacterium]
MTADDRTGAFEVAALLAAAGSPVAVSTYPDLSGEVVDLASRYMSPTEASSRAAVLPDRVAIGSTWCAHKIDSMLRGNWADEVRSRAIALGRPALLVPAWPAMGRTCRGGVVHVHGEPIGSVLDRVPGAAHLRTADEVVAWCAGAGSRLVGAAHAGGIAVADVADDDAFGAVAAAVANSAVVVAGPAGAVGAVHGARVGRPVPAAPPVADGAVAVVCGSASPVAHRQLARLRAALPHVPICAAPAPGGTAVEAAHALDVARRARPLLETCAALVVVGGDTAASLLGDAVRLVGGFAAPGMPWSVSGSGNGPLVVTKAGAFGGDEALVEVVRLFAG